MPRRRPPHLLRETSRHGKPVWYVRTGKGKRTRIKGEFGTPEFDAAYQAAISGALMPKSAGPSSGTVAWLTERYRETTAWQSLSSATRRQRENILVHVLKAIGREPLAKVTNASIISARDRRAATPAQARHFLDTMRGLFRWALKAKHIKADPTAGVENLEMPRSDGFPVWTEDDVTAYEYRWPIGTRQRVWLSVLLYTGLRRGDAVRLGRQHVRDGIGRIKTEKSGFEVEVALPILPVLARVLASGPCGDMTYICGARGEPLTKESFGNLFREACRSAGVRGSAHGVRKIAATTAANNGATVAQLKAIFGWTDDTMPSLYTRSADRAKLARDAMHKLENEKRTSAPAPGGKVRARTEKPQ